jgi:hypothetical protein
MSILCPVFYYVWDFLPKYSEVPLFNVPEKVTQKQIYIDTWLLDTHAKKVIYSFIYQFKWQYILVQPSEDKT